MLIPGMEADLAQGRAGTRSERKQAAIVGAAAEVFLSTGYAGASMDEIASRSGVSKQTIYKHFSSKEALFVAVLTQMMREADTAVHTGLPQVENRAQLEAYLLDYAVRQLTIVLTPGLMQLRRLVVAEAQRFPELAKLLYARGPARALEVMGSAFEQLAGKKLLRFSDATVAASQFNWLVMADPVNRVMMLGDEAIPTKQEIHRHAEAAVATFLAAFLHPDKR
ncbi:TetR/AcrR family transcriptional regulator [Rhizobium leguminosarum]|uniref:TetR/AcrR family transcriptional regulator n=1 Tax=Rhizobium leguminosarum TaxID=384 RepID=UPI001A91ACE7|nr:TetR/AcrR family transcriptional regulator [Rhizobium leguminosarum]MBY5553590.1 TetR/AcrR family transcriptional regulator [Rhizobium leguminosarum]MBY5633527.1 TetR/AcrR family transcriptional regulator [Rhizobium leguminosarum]MBY5687624.1 TetR/AcrR family transcriptional regulator [Rhizobium leguminosarum]MBY5724817.1 TetR/AcrR family transcriptional regulator [Rhizobium leguminosarum]MBY5742129.1 TetR/AcrR family transcriptional regulator [Rhizobium leguminosarum]